MELKRVLNVAYPSPATFAGFASLSTLANSTADYSPAAALTPALEAAYCFMVVP
jgi:hypothetical protein